MNNDSPQMERDFFEERVVSKKLSGISTISGLSPALSSTTPAVPVPSWSKSALDLHIRTAQKKRLAQACHHFSRAVVESKYVVLTTTLLTLYALTSDDLRLGATEGSADPIFNAITAFTFLVFFIEIILCCIGKQEYFGGFFFWLDVISTVSLVLDITWVNDYVADVVFGSGEDDYQMGNSNTARLGARATRVVRVLRLVRIVKLYKAILDARSKNKTDAGEEDWDDEEEEEQQVGPTVESDLARRMSDLTTRRCVMLIIIMMLVYPMLSADDALQYPTSEDYAANLVHEQFTAMMAEPDRRPRYENALLRMVSFHNWFQSDMTECPPSAASCPAQSEQFLFWMGVTHGEAATTDEAQLRNLAANASLSAGAVARFEASLPVNAWYQFGEIPSSAVKVLESRWNTVCPTRKGKIRIGISLATEATAAGAAPRCPEDLRGTERKLVVAKLVDRRSYEEWHFAFYLDRRRFSRIEALENFIRTFFICVLLCCASAQFAHDSRVLVLMPIETMIMKVQLISKNPLVAAKLTDDAFKAEEIERSKRATQKQRKNWLKAFQEFVFCSRGDVAATTQANETAILEKTIMKLGALLALGFGEAGVNIISHNMKGHSASVDAMVPGQRVDCIIGSTHMGNFSTFTEVLQGRVMTFVNQVAEVIHGVVDAYHGAPSRTSGDSFLVVWTLRDINDAVMVARMADMSVLAFSLVLAGINRSHVLAKYRQHPGLQQRLGRRLRVSVTFGLHSGWAIEGALGSEFKIDATYVSPNVNITEQVQRAAETYGTSALLTSALHCKLTDGVSKRCRLIDRVKIRGSPTPMDLYCIDVYHMKLVAQEPLEGVRWTTRQRFRARQFLEAEKVRRLNPTESIAEVFDKDPDLRLMSKPYTVSFSEVFGMGYQNYQQGEWKAARRLLSRTLMQLNFEDGPSAALLRYMAQYGYMAPQGWKGVHPLEDVPTRNGIMQRRHRSVTLSLNMGKGVLDPDGKVAKGTNFSI
eukprot:TRINITY_DN4414_c0_g3_i1.p1 TRINITY_DN4414_c0_g3~~TRINITY_DN4414_c0_g3_i1.p1  ORF type:complete len:986 (+),score=209.09 TRINITY_DN4414_c0_g3_i1:188-3145(+)